MSKKVKEIKLHLGCGIVAPVDWINIDSSLNAKISRHKTLRQLIAITGLLDKRLLNIKWPNNIVIRDLTKPLPYSENTVSYIYTSHTLEHIHINDAQNLLKECLRVLKPGGVIRIVVPDLKVRIKEYLEGKDKKVGDYTTSADKFMDSINIASAGKGDSIFRKVFNYFNDRNFHKWMYDYESLSLWLKNTGFIGMQNMNLYQSKIPKIRMLERKSRFDKSICIEAVKKNN